MMMRSPVHKVGEGHSQSGTYAVAMQEDQRDQFIGDVNLATEG